MFYNSRETGNLVFHIALEKGGGLQPIVTVPLSFSNEQLIMKLLDTDYVAGQKIKTATAKYFLLFDGNRLRPYPSVMIWKYIEVDGNEEFVDVGNDDMRIIPYVADNYLRSHD